MLTNSTCTLLFLSQDTQSSLPAVDLSRPATNATNSPHDPSRERTTPVGKPLQEWSTLRSRHATSPVRRK